MFEPWSLAGRIVWKGLEGVILLEEVFTRVAFEV